MAEDNTPKKANYTINWMVFWVLLILTVGEFYLGVSSGGNAAVGPFMWFFALMKAGFVIAFYMNISRVFGGGEKH